MSAGMTSEAPVQRERRRDDDAGDRPLCALSAVGDDVIAASNALASVMDPTAEVVPVPPAEMCRAEQRGKDDCGFTPRPRIHVWGVERVEGSTARARRGSARRIRRGPLAPGITGRPPGVRSASAGSNVRRGGRSTAKIEPKEKFPLFAPFCWVQARRYLARRLSRKARARFGRWGDSGGGSDGGFHAKAAWWLLAVDPDPGANGSKSSART